MLATIPLSTASSLLVWSNRIYITGSLLTLASAALALYEQYSKSQGRLAYWKLRTQTFVIIAAFVSFCGSVLAITFSNVVVHLKDVDLSKYETQANQQITTLQKQTADANRSAADANLKNTQLQIALTNHETSEGKIEADLAKQNKATSDFAHALALQQGIMAEQTHVSPALSQAQIQALSEILKPFAGQKVIMRSTSDTVVLRLMEQTKQALLAAGIDVSRSSIVMGALYQGVSVGVHDPHNVPPLANALVQGLRNAGIDPHPVSDPQFVPEGYVGLFFGPN